MMRRVAYALSLLTIVLAGFVVPLPLVEFSPGGATAIPPLIELEDEVETTPIDGQLSLLTVRIAQPSFAEVVRAWSSPVRDLAPRSTVFPAGVDSQDYFDFQRSEFQRTFELAVAVGVRAAGRDVEFSSAPLVAQVLPSGPAADRLQAGDVIQRIDGTAVESAEEVIDAASDLSEGQVVTLTVDRAGDEVEVEVVAGRVPGLDHPGLGISLLDISDDVDLPFEVRMGSTSIGGPSAGLMIALTTYDLFSDEDLTAGRHIAGTGTIDAQGRVGEIGGIEEKVIAAEHAGAEIMLVPASQEAAARSRATGDLTIVPVRTLDEAIGALRTTRAS